MERNTVIAIVLSALVIGGGMFLQSTVFSPKKPPATVQASAIPQSSVAGQQSPAGSTASPVAGFMPVQVSPGTTGTENYTLTTDVFTAVFSPKGAVMKSLRLNKHLDGENPVELLLGGVNFSHSWGDRSSAPIDDVFSVRARDENSIEFFAVYKMGTTGPEFEVTKRFVFKPTEYLFLVEMRVKSLDSRYGVPLPVEKPLYTLHFGPQIGPTFQKLDDRYDFRKFIHFAGGSRKDINVDAGRILDVQEKPQWFGVVGKYFTMLVSPVMPDFRLTYSREPVEGFFETSMAKLTRPSLNISDYLDTYRVYFGPKTAQDLGRYDRRDDNSFGIQDLNLTKSIDENIFLNWLENILKLFLQMFHFVIPNWGIAIILVTILVKLLTFPISRKAIEPRNKMAALGPKIEEIRAKYKDNPQKMNEEMGLLYQKEGVNPLSGCLPMLIQFPIFFAMYGIFNSHFDLRGASFIGGWISDLSKPDILFSFGNFQIPVLGWRELHLLPFLYLASQLVSSIFMQTPGSASNTQAKIMMFGLPIFFFFILYDTPSGLLVYWITSNILSVVETYLVNNVLPPPKPKKKISAFARNRR